MITESRKEARQQLAALLQADLVGAGKPAQAVYDYQVGDFQGQSPVVVVSSGGTLRERLSFLGTKPMHVMNIHVFVLYAAEDGSWTEADAENALDDIEQKISATCSANQRTAWWEAITPTGQSATSSVMIGGKEYRTELITVRLA